ncbi:MAG: RnfABCDGE type electron transport complex subunit D [Gammaproteobacteria bacterium]
MTEAPVSSPHWHNQASVSRLMLDVIYALLPAIVCYSWLFGWGLLLQCLLAVLFAVSLEYLILKLRRRDPRLFLSDGSAVVTALLFALTISPLTPWWLSLLGIAFAIVVVKHLFGGIGYNIFNPAMAGYVFILVSFPAQMTLWPLPLSLVQHEPSLPDVLSGATALGELKTALGNMGMVSEVMTGDAFGHFAAAGWEWVNLCYLLGGLYLLARGAIKWHIPLAVLAGVFISSAIFYVYDPDLYASPLFHLSGGATIICAFFIATDPVSAAATGKGRLIYGFLIGVLLYVIRQWGIYPDGAAFAVLLANALVPLIDSQTRPRVFGEQV